MRFSSGIFPDDLHRSHLAPRCFLSEGCPRLARPPWCASPDRPHCPVSLVRRSFRVLVACGHFGAPYRCMFLRICCVTCVSAFPHSTDSVKCPPLHVTIVYILDKKATHSSPFQTCLLLHLVPPFRDSEALHFYPVFTPCDFFPLASW